MTTLETDFDPDRQQNQTSFTFSTTPENIH